MTDLDTISHLDFDVEEETAIPCAGYARFSGQGEVLEENMRCKNPPRLIATHNCCGVRKYLCIGCYNWNIVTFVAHAEVGFCHFPCNSIIYGKPFLELPEWL